MREEARCSADRTQRQEPATSGTDGPTPTLVDRAGDPPAMARLIDAFYDRVERDDLLNPFFPGRAGLPPGVGNQAGRGQLAAGRDAARARTGAPVGLGRGPASPALRR